MFSTKENGEFIATQALVDPSQSKVVRSKGDHPEGPFVEAKVNDLGKTPLTGTPRRTRSGPGGAFVVSVVPVRSGRARLP